MTKRKITIALKGIDATRFMARKAAEFCLSQEGADKLLDGATGPYLAALTEELHRCGFRVRWEQ